MKERLTDIAKHFCIEGNLLEYKEIVVGNINKTYYTVFQVGAERKEFILQKVNTYVFKNPEKVMNNIDLVTEWIRAKDQDRKTLHFHHTKNRSTYVIDNGEFWRLFNFIPSMTFEKCDDLVVIRSAGKAFGHFQKNLSDFNAKKLFITIPDFHDTRKRFEKLWEDVAKDPAGKVEEVREELGFLKSVEKQACLLTDLSKKGKLPIRVTHNDTKINNVLFDKDTKEAITVIDLDTVMPGLVGHDFGDAIRFAGNTEKEDSSDYEKVRLNLDVFRAFTEGFLSETKDKLTKKEIETLPLSVFALTIELAVRFLDDYIQGSLYFKINYPEHNLVRTRCQIALAKDVLQKLDEMTKIVQECLN